MADDVKIFLSTVTAEFRNYRDDLSSYLTRPNVSVKVQEDFYVPGNETLLMLDDYIQYCDIVIHLVGDMTGGWAKAPSIEAIKHRYQDLATRFPMLQPFLQPDGPSLSYTQWEAWLALYHGRYLIIATPLESASRYKDYQLLVDQQTAQQEHLARLEEYERYEGISFKDINNLEAKLWNSRLHDIIPQLSAPILERAREMASLLLDVGRDAWKIPRFVAPLNLEIKDEEAEDNKSRPTSITALTKAINRGENLVLFGEGGIGKTTFLLELSSTLLDEKCPRIPLYIEAANWARTNTEILEYIASSPAATRHGVTADEIMKLAGSGLLTLVVNGWNEVTGAQKLNCRERFRALTITSSSLNIVVVTRSVTDIPDLKAGKHVHVRGLTWQSQTRVIRFELDEGSANMLVERLARDMHLRHAARSPLILKGLLAQAKRGDVISPSVFDLLGAVVDAFEEDDQRRFLLNQPPLDSQHRYFMEALASHLTSKQETTSSRQELVPVVLAAAKQLVDDGQFGSLPTRPSEVLDALSSHHLLHADGIIIRFAHHRFQEYFTAAQLLRACVDGGEHGIDLLREAVNQPFWEDALWLVGGKLKGVDSCAQARSLLVRTALGVDLGFACDLAGACALSEIDDSDLYRDLITHVNALCDSPLHEVTNYGVVCLIASGFTVFADRLWPLIESDDRETRFNTYRLNGSGISLNQLGEAAETRIAAWSPERRAELMHELAQNPDNYDYLVRVANDAVEDEVRAAAITALSWSFPASEATLQAWLNAPASVQLKHEVIGVVEYAMEQGDCYDEVRDQLGILSSEHSTAELKLRLALTFPDDVDPNAIDVALTRLRGINHRDDYATSLVALVMKHAPVRLNNLARELMLSECVVPYWACKIVRQESAEIRAEIFEAAWVILRGGNAKHLSVQAVGPLANREHILRSVREWLNYCQDRRGDLSEAERESGRQLGYLLANVSGDDLLSIVIELGESASYRDASELLGLVLTRIVRNEISSTETTQWLPSIELVRTLIATFGKKQDDAAVPQHKVHSLLCCIASHVAPAEFGDLLLEGCRRYLDSWEIFYAVHDEWLKRPIGDRPINPHWGNYLYTAMVNWGFGALTDLLELLEHPYANELIPGIVVRIVSGPWADKKEGTFQALDIDFKEVAQRRLTGRVLRQPDDTYQGLTDIAARALSAKLTDLVHQLRTEQAADSAEWNNKRAAYRMRGLLNAVANTPSPEIVGPLMHALADGFIDVYSAVNALKGLVRQGVFLEDAAVVARIEALYAEEAKAKWFDESKKHEMSELSQLMFFVRPVSLLSKPLSDYIVEWQRFAYVNDIIRHVGAIPSNESWGYLLELGRTLEMNGRRSEELSSALVSALSFDHFIEFLNLIADGTWFTWCQSAWGLKHMAPDILRVIGDDSERRDSFLAACERSGSRFASGLACEVLTLIPDGDSIRLRYGLAALDAGKVGDSRCSVYSMLKEMFTLRVPLGGVGHYEIHQKSCNELRCNLYLRARGDGVAANISRRLLTDVECQRREYERPTDEPRHPAAGTAVAWTEVLAIIS